MKVAPQVQLFAVAPPTATEAAAPSPIVQPGSATQPAFSPPLLPLGSILPNGAYKGFADLSSVLGQTRLPPIDWAKVHNIQGSLLQGSPHNKAAELIAGAAGPSPIAASSPIAAPAASPKPPGIVSTSKSAFAWFSGSTTVVHFSRGVSQAQISHCVGALPMISQQQAGTLTDQVTRFFHSHAGDAVYVAITAGGVSGAVARFFGYTKQAPYIAAAGFLLVLGLYSVFGKPSTPYSATWNMDAIRTEYQDNHGIPPRQVVEEITQDKDGLVIAHHAIEEGGKRDNLTQHLIADGRPHPVAEFPDEVVVTTQKGNTLTSIYSRNAHTLETDIRDLSADQKTMTMTAVRVDPSGQTIKNVTVYQRQ